MDTGTSFIDIGQWHSLIYTYKTISETLTLLCAHDKEHFVDTMSLYVSNYSQLQEEIDTLFSELTQVWDTNEEIEIPAHMTPSFDIDAIEALPHIERASLLAIVQDMKKLHASLCSLAKKLNDIHSPLPTFFDAEDIPINKRFLWGNMEHLKAALLTFIIFWVSTYF